jgi:hypothetical protein
LPSVNTHQACTCASPGKINTLLTKSYKRKVSDYSEVIKNP